jgi:hypothetical protein
MRVGAELGLAQETELPYFLLWGRRDAPTRAKNDDGIYSWTPRVLAGQLIVTMRRTGWNDEAAAVRRPKLPAAENLHPGASPRNRFTPGYHSSR